jgi:FMN phosphatase YigB (HAD superfamily)
MYMQLAIIDFNRTIYDPETGGLMPGARHLLEVLGSHGIACVLVSMREPGRQQTLKDLGVADLFAATYFVDAKTPQLFAEIIERHHASPETTCVIGDLLHQEIRAGVAVGAKTIHVRQGAFAHMQPQSPLDRAWRTVTSLAEAEELLCGRGAPEV